MYDVYFWYFDGNEYMCKDINSIKVPSATGTNTYTGDEIASHNFRIYSELYLSSNSSSYTVSCTGLKAIEIRKK